MSGKSPYASDAERKAAKLEADRQRHLRIKADPEKYAQLLATKRADRARASDLRDRDKAMPKPVNATLYRQHGPFAPLFALQAA